MIALRMREFSFFEVFLCCEESEAESGFHQHWKEGGPGGGGITATSMKHVLKHGSFGPVCDPRMAKRFRIS